MGKRCITTLSGLLLMLSESLPVWAQQLPEDLGSSLIVEPIGPQGWNLRFVDADLETARRLRPLLGKAFGTVESFFSRPFAEPASIVIAPDRQSFTHVLQKEWGVAETACWMVATGVADFMVVLSPRVWKEQACEHDPSDSLHLGNLLTHELAHVYHGQFNPTRDFSGTQGIDWLVEGLAVLVAGQLQEGRLASPAEAVEKGAVPTRLSQFWSGRYRYGLSGSMVDYINRRFGRPTLEKLLKATDLSQVLEVLQLSEEELIANWRKGFERP